MNDIEILAPVGGEQQLIAAVASGADAVYLGTKGFNARSQAANFDDSSLMQAVSYCHARGVKVAVTVNTLVKDGELEKLMALIESIAEAGPDAVILQDLAVAKLFRECCPDIPRHASTQMSIHNSAGAEEMRSLGFSRVILARELTLKEIKEISRTTDIELEVFVHGALCMGISGMCYLSSMIGGRSGNRGRCAQPCRLDFRCEGRDYALSLKDMSHISHISQLKEAGVASLKIEGRMKRPEYVAAAVDACKKALAGERYDIKTLEDVFSRSGFTDGYLTGKRDLTMFGRRTQEDEKRSAKSLSRLRQLYGSEYSRISIDFKLELDEESAKLTVSDGVNTVTEEGQAPTVSPGHPLTEEMARKSLYKTGSTPYLPGEFLFSSRSDLMLSISAVNSMRRNALNKLTEVRSKIKPYSFEKISLKEFSGKREAPKTAKIRLRFENSQQIPPDAEEYERIILPIEQIRKAPGLIKRFGESLVGELPALAWPSNEAKIQRLLEQLKEMGLKRCLAENIYGINMAKKAGIRVIGGSGLNIINSISLSEYEEMGLEDATVSFELSLSKIKALNGSIPIGIVAYGFLPLMRFRACPINSCENCGGKGIMTDRTGRNFKIICHEKQYSSLHNSDVLYIADKNLKELDFITLFFTDENISQCGDIIKAYENSEKATFERTGGLYFREIE